MNKIKIVITLSLFSLMSVATSYACTTLRLHYKNNYIVGRNFDWPDKYAFLVINPVGELRKEKDLLKLRKTLVWIAKYGSVTIDLAKNKKQQSIARWLF